MKLKNTHKRKCTLEYRQLGLCDSVICLQCIYDKESVCKNVYCIRLFSEALMDMRWSNTSWAIKSKRQHWICSPWWILHRADSAPVTPADIMPQKYVLPYYSGQLSTWWHRGLLCVWTVDFSHSILASLNIPQSRWPLSFPCVHNIPEED